MFANVFEFKPSPTRVSRNTWNDQSSLERHFFRIARELVARWKQGDVDVYLNSLLLDDRGNRQGFPAEVLEELMFLSNISWYLQHPSFNRTDECLVEQFSFNPMSHLDSRCCEPKRTWVY
jgi:hypothetical protein